MIHGISGKTGGGKSYEAVVRHIIPTITEHKRKVVTNLPLNVDHFCSVFGEYCRDLIEVVDGHFHNYGGERPFSRKEHYLQYEDWQNENGNKVHFFIDECHLALGSGQTNKEVKEFYSMHRHYGFDIMLITQEFRKVDRDISGLVGNHYRAIKKSFIGQEDKYILKVHDGASKTNSTVVATHERQYEKKYFKFYQSHTKSDQAVKEAAPSDINVWWKNKFIYMSGVFALIFIGLVIKILNDNSSVEKEVQTQKLPENKVSLPSNRPISNNQQVLTQQLTKKQISDLKELEEIRAQRRQELESESKRHPFYKVGLHITGWAEYMNRGKIIKNYYIAASQNGQHQFEISLRDLVLAGYTVIVKSGCSIEISYRDYHDFITCDSPRVGAFDEAPEEITQ